MQNIDHSNTIISDLIPPFVISTDEVLDAARGVPILGISKVHPAAVARARDMILNSVSECNRAVFSLKTALNVLTPVGQLPNEVLADILVSVVRVHYEEPGHGVWHTLQWTNLTHVCHSWRTVAFATPSFWAYLRVQVPFPMFSELVARSKASVLSLRVTRDVSLGIDVRDPFLSDEAYPAMDCIAAHFDRLAELWLNAPAVDIVRLCEGLPKYRSAPYLQKLVLERNDHRGDCFLGAQLSLGNCTQLRHLQLQDIDLRWNHPILSSALTTLIVAYNLPPEDFDTGRPTGLVDHEQFMDAMQALAPTLEVLNLELTIPALSPTSTISPVATTVISFPRLRELVVKSKIAQFAHFFSSMSPIQVPCTFYLDLCGKTGFEGVCAKLDDCFNCHQPLRSAWIVARETSIYYEGWTNHSPADMWVWNNRFESDDSALTLSVDLEPDSSTGTFWDNFFRTIEDLWLSGFIARYLPGNSPWSRCWASMPHLKRVLIRDEDYLHDCLRALSCTPDPDSHESPPKIPAPLLNTIYLEKTDYCDLPYSTEASQEEGGAPAATQRLSAVLRDCLKSRAEAGVPLQLLLLGERCSNVRPEDVEELRRYVGNVQQRPERTKGRP